MGSVFMAAATLATSTACRAACAAASVVRSTADAKPQVPSTMTRTARPVSSASNSVCGVPSDSPICWPRSRSARKSACWAPRALACASAASARSRSGRAVNSGSICGSRSFTTPMSQLTHLRPTAPAAAVPRPAAPPGPCRGVPRTRVRTVPAHGRRAACGTLSEPRREVTMGRSRAGDRREPGYRAGYRAAARGRRRQRHGHLALRVTRSTGLTVVRCDVRDAASVDAAFGEVEKAQGPVEVLVANAGMTHDQLLALMSEDDFDLVLDTNLAGAYRVAKRAVRGMMKMRRGPPHLHLLGRGPVRLGGPGQLRGVQGRAGRPGPVAGPRARLPRHHRQRDRPRLRGQRHDGRACRRTGRRPSWAPSRWPGSPPRTRSRRRWRSWPAPDAAYITGAVIPVDGGLGMGLLSVRTSSGGTFVPLVI